MLGSSSAFRIAAQMLVIRKLLCLRRCIRRGSAPTPPGLGMIHRRVIKSPNSRLYRLSRLYIIRINLSGLIHQSIVVRQVPQHALLSPTGKQTSQ